jgi:ankyrin repeat protein
LSTDINTENEDGLTALHVATMLDVVQYLHGIGDQNVSKGIHLAAAKGQIDTLQYLIESGADIEAVNKVLILQTFYEQFFYMKA